MRLVQAVVSEAGSYVTDQAIGACLVTTTLPPHCPSESVLYDILSFFPCHLGVIKGDYHSLNRIVRIAGKGLLDVG